MEIWFFVGWGLVVAALAGAAFYVFMATLITWSDRDKKKHLKK